jgi:flagellin-like hook-associated protein FlgL
MQRFNEGVSEITRDLEALKVALIGMTADDLAPTEAAALAQEISAIRLHLKRLDHERRAAAERVDAARKIDVGGT